MGEEGPPGLSSDCVLGEEEGKAQGQRGVRSRPLVSALSCVPALASVLGPSTRRAPSRLGFPTRTPTPPTVTAVS